MGRLSSGSAVLNDGVAGLYGMGDRGSSRCGSGAAPVAPAAKRPRRMCSLRRDSLSLAKVAKIIAPLRVFTKSLGRNPTGGKVKAVAPHSASGVAGSNLAFYSSPIYPEDSIYRAYGFPVRCARQQVGVSIRGCAALNLISRIRSLRPRDYTGSGATEGDATHSGPSGRSGRSLCPAEARHACPAGSDPKTY